MGGNPFWWSRGFYLGTTFILISLYVISLSIMNNVNFASYTDDNTPYDIGDVVIQVTESPTICKRVGQKLNALSKVTRYNDLSKKCMFLHAFFFSQFSYCPLRDVVKLIR